ncbi:hypothetical protein [Klebsiella michiganensis]|uniref:hypothetical protein n=1 Tax=Klebsiella michiganensis TaxID=1134687 RepID=UPI00080754DE|nr:hypothetical protein [Klebsiella michiganensis]
MAAGIPKEKSVELIEMYGDMLKAGVSIDEMSYWRSLRELENDNSSASVSALGLLHATAGFIDKANQVFTDGVEKFHDASIPANHLFMLRATRNENLVKDFAYAYADKYQSKKMTVFAYSYAYRYGDKAALDRYMSQHIKLLSDEEGRLLAEKHKEELLTELDDAYVSSGCTKEQFQLLAETIAKVAKEYEANYGNIEVSKNHNCCYVVDINNKDPKTIAKMNYSLAEAVCMEPLLDNCKLIGRFSPIRELHTGVSYVG